MKQLPLSFRKKVMPANRHNDELAERLFLMPKRILDKRLKYKRTSHKLMLDLAKKFNYSFVFGYRIWRYPGRNWRYDLVPLLLSSKGIVDPVTDPWEENVELHYCGVGISEESFGKEEYLKTNIDKYIKDRSPFRLFERDYIKKKDDNNK